MTLQKIADAVGVSVDTAHRVARDVELSDIGKLPGDDGKYRPMRYAARAVDTPVRMPPTAPRTGAALRLPVFSSGSTAIPPQNGLQLGD